MYQNRCSNFANCGNLADGETDHCSECYQYHYKVTNIPGGYMIDVDKELNPEVAGSLLKHLIDSKVIGNVKARSYPVPNEFDFVGQLCKDPQGMKDYYFPNVEERNNQTAQEGG